MMEKKVERVVHLEAGARVKVDRVEVKADQKELEKKCLCKKSQRKKEKRELISLIH